MKEGENKGNKMLSNLTESTTEQSIQMSRKKMGLQINCSRYQEVLYFNVENGSITCFCPKGSL